MTDQHRPETPELQAAYDMVRAGRPTDALAAVLELLRARFAGDERRVFATIAEAKRAHDERGELEQLAASLQALSLEHARIAERATEMHHASILAEGGRDAVLCDAGNDGSSRLCPRCGALVAIARFEHHCRRWCPALPPSSVEEEEEEEES